MKRNHFTPILLSAALAVGSLSLNAATSGVVGAVSVTVPAGPTVMSMPFLKSVVVQAPVSSVTNEVVDLGTTIPALTGPHYLHVLSGTDAGRVYNIASSSGTTVTLDVVPAALAATDSVAIRPHVTIADLGTPPTFTTITLLDPGGGLTVGTYLFTGWSIPTDTVIMPGEGFALNNGTAYDITLYGTVSEDDVILETAGGGAIVGNIDPVNGSTDVLSSVIAGAPTFATLTELDTAGSPVVYTKLFTGWSPDPSGIDVSNLKTFVINTGNPIDIVHAGNVIAP